MQTDTQLTQQSSQVPWPPSGWLTKQQAAERLNLSPSRVFALGEARTISTQRLKSPTSGQFVTIFHAGDVERVIYERENPDKLSRVPAKLSDPVSAIASFEQGEVRAEHSTEHYSIRWWRRPGPDRPYFEFFIEGPGAKGVSFRAISEDCGTQMIRGLESAYQFGRRDPAAKGPDWITISEAADHTGLPASIVLRLVESAKLPAIDVGPRPGGKWRVKRSELDALEGQR